MFIQFISPGGAGKTTIAKQLAPKIDAVCLDLDEYFLRIEGGYCFIYSTEWLFGLCTS